MNDRLPVLSGVQLIKALERDGWRATRQRGRHVLLKNPERPATLVVPLHIESSSGGPSGFDYHHISAGAVESFVRAVRLRLSTGRRPASCTYEHDVEQFRHSPSVVQAGGGWPTPRCCLHRGLR